jgi:flagellar basal-body rod protein FlgF
MIYGLYQSAAGMLTNEYRQAVLANNIANADTVGFKRDVATLAERMPARLAGDRSGPSAVDLEGLSGGLWLGQTFTDFSDAPKVRTDNPYDIALEGPGFLVVAADGQRQYTRDGRMLKSPDGTLVAASDGAPLLGRGGVPIRLNPYGGPPSFDTEGRVVQDGAVVGELEIVDFENYATLRKVGAARFTGPDDQGAPAPALVQSGYIENSGVRAVPELVSMMEASHAYQLNARLVTLQDDSVGKLISTLLHA